MTTYIGSSAVAGTPGVEGDNTAAGSGGVGVLGKSTGTGSAGVEGLATATTGGACGVYGSSSGPTGSGCIGDGQQYGLLGRAAIGGGAGVQGEAHGVTGSLYGVVGSCNIAGANACGCYGWVANGIGVTGSATTGTGGWFTGQIGVNCAGNNNDALRAVANAGYYAGNFYGEVSVNGYLYKSGGGYLIDHPDPAKSATHFLNHCFVESDEMTNTYSGSIVLDADGRGVVQMADYVLHAAEDFRYQLTPVGASMPNLHVERELGAEASFVVAGGAPGAKASWEVKGRRADAWAKASHPGVEVSKGKDAGLFRHPEHHGLGHDRSIQAARIAEGPQPPAPPPATAPCAAPSA